jgi:peptide/nickel transport system ATP-binding protein
MSIIAETKNLKGYYITQAYGVERTVQAVDDISIQIKQGEIYGIAGESGCGKSTLLKILLGAHRPPLTVVGGSAKYYFDGEEVDVLSMTEKNSRNVRWRKVSTFRRDQCTF